MVILALLFMIVDIWNLRGWTGFFNTFGVNALFTYVLAGMLTKTLLIIKIGEQSLYNWIFTHVCSPLFEKPEAGEPHVPFNAGDGNLGPWIYPLPQENNHPALKWI